MCSRRGSTCLKFPITFTDITHKPDGKYEVCTPWQRWIEINSSTAFSFSPGQCCHQSEINYRWNTQQREREILKPSRMYVTAYPFWSNLHTLLCCMCVGWPLCIASPGLPSHCKQVNDEAALISCTHWGRFREIVLVGPVWVSPFPSILEKHTEVYQSWMLLWKRWVMAF